MKSLIAIIVTLVFSLPVKAEILIFKTATKGQQLNVASKTVEKKSESGYLVINADLSNTSNITISEAQHLTYEKVAGIQSQNTTIMDTSSIEIILADYGKTKKMTLRYFGAARGVYETAFGNTKLKDIGNGLLRYVPSGLSGSSVWREPDFRTGSGTFNLILDIKATQSANTQGKTVTEVIEAYSQTIAAKGYIAE
jgi:hypothetical protein